MKNSAATQPEIFDAPIEKPAPVTNEQITGLALVIERVAMNPEVDVAKLEKIIELQERIIANDAKGQFNAAFSEMQGDIPVITERGEIIVNGVVRSKYAKLEDILEIVRPILKQYGFAIRHRNVFDNGSVKVIGILSHRAGHSEEDEFVAKADNSGSKNDIQALGSTRSYGQRYTTVSLLGISTRGQDDDGATSDRGKQPEAPAGYDKWLEAMSAAAIRGLNILTTGFNEAPKEFRAHITKFDKQKWEAMKKTAAGVKA